MELRRLRARRRRRTSKEKQKNKYKLFVLFGLFALLAVTEDTVADLVAELAVQLGAVAQGEEQLQEDKEGSHHQGLDQVIQQRWRTSFVDPVTDELGNPGERKRADSVVQAVLGTHRQDEFLAGYQHPIQQGKGQDASQGIQQDVEQAVAHCSQKRGIGQQRGPREMAEGYLKGGRDAEQLARGQGGEDGQGGPQDGGDKHHMDGNIDLVGVVFAVAGKL